MKKSFIIALFLLTALTGCATPYHTMKPPLRDADVYPDAQTIAGLTVAVDEVADPDRVRQYFGTDLTREDILPVMIVFTNHEDDRFLVRPGDVLLMDGTNVIDAIPADSIQKMVRGGTDLALQETVIPARGSYRGVLFFKVKKLEAGLYGKVEQLFTGKLSIRIVVTDQDSHERLHFGPFSLSSF